MRNKLFILLAINLFVIRTVTSQSSLITINDTSKVIMPFIDSGRYNNFIYIPYVDFRYNLPEGKAYIVSENYSKKKNPNKYILAEGSFKNSLRVGTFIYYSNRNTKNHSPFVEYQFSNDQLHGNCYYYCNGRKYYVGNYVNGKKNGFFIFYIGNEIEKIEFYNMDSLVIWSDFYKNTLSATGIEVINSLTNEYHYYDSLNRIFLTKEFQEGKLVSYESFNSDGTTQMEAYGSFTECLSMDINKTLDCNFGVSLEFGIIREYNKDRGLDKEYLVIDATKVKDSLVYELQLSDQYSFYLAQEDNNIVDSLFYFCSKLSKSYSVEFYINSLDHLKLDSFKRFLLPLSRKYGFKNYKVSFKPKELKINSEIFFIVSSTSPSM